MAATRWTVRHACGHWATHVGGPLAQGRILARQAQVCAACRKQALTERRVTMSEQLMEVRHRCGCVRRYASGAQGTLRQAIAAQMAAVDCGLPGCPHRGEQGRRLLAREARPAANGREGG